MARILKDALEKEVLFDTLKSLKKDTLDALSAENRRLSNELLNCYKRRANKSY